MNRFCGFFSDKEKVETLNAELKEEEICLSLLNYLLRVFGFFFSGHSGTFKALNRTVIEQKKC